MLTCFVYARLSKPFSGICSAIIICNVSFPLVTPFIVQQAVHLTTRFDRLSYACGRFYPLSWLITYNLAISQRRGNGAATY